MNYDKLIKKIKRSKFIGECITWASENNIEDFMDTDDVDQMLEGLSDYAIEYWESLTTEQETRILNLIINMVELIYESEELI